MPFGRSRSSRASIPAISCSSARGGGPLHGSALAHELGIPALIIPPEPGNFSALGMLLCDARLDLSETFVSPVTVESEPRTIATFDDLEASARESLAGDFPGQDISFERYAEMRFVGQRHNLKVALSMPLTAASMVDAFPAEYRVRYGIASSDAALETQALHVSAFARSRKPDIANLGMSNVVAIPPVRRPVHFGMQHGWLDTDVSQRRALPVGFGATGPATVEEYGSTTLIWPGDRFTIGTLGEIRIDCVGAGAATVAPL